MRFRLWVCAGPALAGALLLLAAVLLLVLLLFLAVGGLEDDIVLTSFLPRRAYCGSVA